jgi:hypothetical protein
MRKGINKNKNKKREKEKDEESSKAPFGEKDACPPARSTPSMR